MSDSCPICESSLREAFRALVLNEHAAIYDHCDDCGFLRAQLPHWLEQAYSDAIAVTDTGLMMRNRSFAVRLTSLFTVLGHSDRDIYLDYAGGYGVLTRLMRDAGFDFYWSDPYCKNLMASGFDYSAGQGRCQLVTAFEVLEHVENPREFVRTALAAGSTDTLIFTTELYCGSPPRPAEWWYYSFETGQHIAFYRHDTLARLAKTLELNFHSSNGFHIFSRRPLAKRRIDLALGRLHPLGAAWARLTRRSKTMDDHDLMVKQLAALALEAKNAHRL